MTHFPLPGMRRKVMRIGGSLVISLPLWWCRVRDVRPGDYVQLSEDEERSLLVRPLPRVDGEG
jgi:antitoxin component of MazEF toxin-antitoxin module